MGGFLGQSGVRSRNLDNLLGRLVHNVSFLGHRMGDFLLLVVRGQLLRVGLLLHQLVFVTAGGKSRS